MTLDHLGRAWALCWFCGWLGLALWAPSAAQAQGQPLCEGLRTILAATPQRYAPLRGPFDSAMDAYQGTVRPGRLATCFTHEDRGHGEYRCEQRLPDDEAAAREVFEALVAAVRACLGPELRPMKGSMPHRAWFRYDVGGERLSISYRRHVPKYADMPPRFMLRLDVTVVEMNQ